MANDVISTNTHFAEIRRRYKDLSLQGFGGLIVIQNLFVRFIKEFLQMNDQIPWFNSEIYIGGIFGDAIERAGDYPAIAIDVGPAGTSDTSFLMDNLSTTRFPSNAGAKYGGHIGSNLTRGDRMETTLINSSIMIHNVSSISSESLEMAALFGDVFSTLKPEIRALFKLHTYGPIQVGAVSEISIGEGNPLYNTQISIPIAYQHSSARIFDQQRIGKVFVSAVNGTMSPTGGGIG